jgi:TonB-dependent SusC/RagA subfamily outer membrane receptor
MPRLHRALGPLLLAIYVIGGCATTRNVEQDANAATKVTSEDIQRAPGQPVEELLNFRVPGVDVSQSPNGNIRVRVRGGTSGNGEPLYVLDGYAIHPGPDGSISGVNPNDIASIEVLKNPTDIAIYGYRGTNGVIVIKTKQGRPKQKKKDT